MMLSHNLKFKWLVQDGILLNLFGGQICYLMNGSKKEGAAFFVHRLPMANQPKRTTGSLGRRLTATSSSKSYKSMGNNWSAHCLMSLFNGLSFMWGPCQRAQRAFNNSGGPARGRTSRPPKVDRIFPASPVFAAATQWQHQHQWQIIFIWTTNPVREFGLDKIHMVYIHIKRASE